MSLNNPRYDNETASDMKRALEDTLSNGYRINSNEVKEGKRLYLEVEKGIFRQNNPIDSKCGHIPPWERTPCQITRDVSDVERYTLDESGLAARLADEVRGWLVWNVEDKEWYEWLGDHWEVDKGGLHIFKTSELLHKQLVYESPEYMTVSINPSEKSNKSKAAITIDKKLLSLQEHAARIHTREMIIKAATALNYHIFGDSKEIPFKNGLFNVETGELIPHSPENYNTTVGNVELDLNVPNFEPGEKFLNEISYNPETKTNDLEWIHSVLRILGEMLRWGNVYQIIVIFYGTGGNGKGVLIDWLTAALGSLVGDCSPMELSRNNKDGRQTTIHDNIGCRRIILFKEAGSVQYDDDIIRRMTGEKKATWKRIHTGDREIPHVATPLLITNNLPTVETGGMSLVRRQVGVPFELNVTKVDENLINKLATPEGNKWLVSKIINTLLEDHKAGKDDLKNNLCPRISQFTKDLIGESDVVYQFIQECIVKTENDDDRISRTYLYSSFCGFAYSFNGVNPTDKKYRITPKKFQERLAGHNIKVLPSNARLTPCGNPIRNVYSHLKLNEYGEECYNYSRD